MLSACAVYKDEEHLHHCTKRTENISQATSTGDIVPARLCTVLFGLRFVMIHDWVASEVASKSLSTTSDNFTFCRMHGCLWDSYSNWINDISIKCHKEFMVLSATSRSLSEAYGLCERPLTTEPQTGAGPSRKKHFHFSVIIVQDVSLWNNVRLSSSYR